MAAVDSPRTIPSNRPTSDRSANNGFSTTTTTTNNNNNNSCTRQATWPTNPGAGELLIPPAPTMTDIQGICFENAVTNFRRDATANRQQVLLEDATTISGDDNTHNNYGAHATITSVSTRDFSQEEYHCAAVAAVEAEIGINSFGDTSMHETHQTAVQVDSTVFFGVPPQQNKSQSMSSYGGERQQISSDSQAPRRPTEEVTFPSAYVPFCGFLDENGIIHQASKETTTEANADNESKHKKSTSEARSFNDNEEEESSETSASVEDVLRASLNFERSHPENRFSSSLDHYYSSSRRNLYPSLEDVDDSVPRKRPSESVGTACAEVIASAASATNLAFGMDQSLVPEPPGTDDLVGRRAQNLHGDDDEIKIGVVGAQTTTHAYAIASPENGLASATVLGTTQTPEEALLQKLAAEDAELLALKRSAYVGAAQIDSGSTQAMSASYHDQPATVVAITEHDVHPADISSNDAVAELIGEQEFPGVGVASLASAATVGNPAAVRSPVASMATDAVLAVEEPGYAVVDSEATIIDQDAGWPSSRTEEALVLNNDDSSIPYSERKLPAMPSAAVRDCWVPPHNSFDGSGTSYEGVAVAVAHGDAEISGLADEAYRTTVAFAGEEAEVLGITEEIHPAEITGNEAQAELVAAAAFPQSSNPGVEATASSLEPDEEIQSATVLGYEDENDMDPNGISGMLRAQSYGAPRPDRVNITARAYSAPSAVGAPVSVDETVGIAGTQDAVAALETVAEEDWMRTPSIAGSNSGHPVVAMLPPSGHDSEGGESQAEFAVASLEAYASSPPAVDNTNCRSFADNSARSPAQRPVAVASLSAYASAPDPTDCRLVNQQSMQPQSSDGLDPVMPPPRSFNSNCGTSDGGSVGSAASNRGGFQKLSSSLARGMEMLFGDTKPSQGRRSHGSDESYIAQSVQPRELLPWSVIYSEATNMWVATVNTNQKALDSKNVVEASKSLRAFSVVTERQATCLAKAWSPPRMHNFSDHPACQVCEVKFAVFRRAAHCRNCGICVCPSCVVPWPSKMVPETYNIKKESFINICKACDWLCTSFRLSLLEGNLDKAIALHATGNVNLVTPFANVKGELFYPVHCAALGGNLDILKWLVDENCCPIKSVRVSGRCRDSANSFTEISTSKGRSLLGIALENCNVGIVRYLVVEKGIQLSGEKDITMDTLCRNLDLVLRFLPEDATSNHHGIQTQLPDLHRDAVYEDHRHCEEKSESHNLRSLETTSDGSVNDACIICFDATINCVAAPCGHQICCIECSRNISRCPVCACDCTFMRVFRP